MMPDELDLYNLHSLKKLALSSASINTMYELCFIPSLESLEMDFAQMGRLPQEIDRLINLKRLHLKCKVATLPKTFYRLTN